VRNSAANLGGAKSGAELNAAPVRPGHARIGLPVRRFSGASRCRLIQPEV